jgi:ABC-type transport system involved in multi-copper enzyme maturation permease subunit
MPIFDQSYRPYTGERTGQAARVLAIMLTGLRTAVRKRSFLALLLLASGTFLVAFAQLYLRDYARALNLPTDLGPGQALLPRETGAAYFLGFLLGQRVFLGLLTISVGAGLVADDLASNALPLYLSRPLGRGGYIGGKLLSAASVGAIVTLLPALLLWVLLATKAVGHGDAPPLAAGLGAVAFSCFLVLCFSLVMLGVSSMTGSRRAAAFYVVILYLGSSMIGDVLRHVTEHPWLRLVSLHQQLELAGRLFFALPPEEGQPAALAWAALGLLGLLCAVAFGMLWLRVTSRSRA